jgi:hypothetical protein
MARGEIEQDGGDLADQQRSRFQERRRERRGLLALQQLGHRRHTAFAAARDVEIVGAGFLQRQPDIFAAALDGRPIVQLIAHRRSFQSR